MRDYAGVIHVHTRYSDGSGTIDDILKAARKTNVDFLVVTDHNTLRVKEEGLEGWYNETLLLAGQEITSRRNHYLALGIDKEIEVDSKPPSVYVEEVRKQGGLGFIAHPCCRKKRSIPFIRERSWTAWDVRGFTGLELWSYMIDWVNPINLLNLPYYYLFPEKAITGPKKDDLKIWDKLTRTTQVVAIGGVDAHAKPFLPFWWLKIFPYEKIFKTVRTHVLIDRFEKNIHKDKQKVYDALARGHCYLSYDLYHDSTGFEFKAEAKDNNRDSCEGTAIMGDKLKFTPGLRLIIKSPRKALIKVVHNGDCFLQKKADGLTLDIEEPGVYRVEAYIDDHPWVFTNPIYIK